MEDISLIFQNLVELQKQDPTAPKRGRRDRRGKPIVNYSDSETPTETPAQEPVQETYEKYMEAALKEVSTNPNLSFLKLSKLDIEIIVEQFGYFIRGRIEVCDIQCLDSKESAKDMSYLEQAKYLLSFYERGLMIGSDRRYEPLDIVSIYGNSIYLSPYLKAVLLGIDCHSNLKAILEPEYIKRAPGMQFVGDYLEQLMRYLDDGECNLISAGNIIRHYLELLWEGVEVSWEINALKSIIEDFGMDKLDFFACSLLYRAHKRNDELELQQIAAYLGRNRQEKDELLRLLQRRYLSAENRLIQTHGSIFRRRNELELKGELHKRFEQSEGDYEAKDEQQDRLKHLLSENGELFTLLQTTQRLPDLVLNNNEYQLIESIIARLKNPEYYDLSRWSLRSPSLSTDNKALNSCLILLYGAAGAGKTYSAGVIANELGRDLIKIEASQLRDKYYGETEKRVKELFEAIRDANQDPKTAPVFLLNEADVILHKRLDSQRSNVNSTENAIQNIFLEELEKLPGILILTTNLMDNMDKALFRRFHFKLEFKLPDASAASRLWRLHLVKEIPGAAEIDCEYLGHKYCLSGGLIRIIVQNACYHAMQRGENAKLLLEDIERYAELEALGKHNLERKVGF